MTNVFDHPWLGGLFSDEGAMAIWSAERQCANLLAVEAAYSRALGAVGRVDPAAAERVAKLIDDFVPDMADLRHGTARDGLPVPALVRQLRAAAGTAAAAVHTGTTSQDIMDTALAMALRETTAQLNQRIERLSVALERLSDRFGQVPLMGRTRMQAALPTKVADRIAAWRTPLPRHLARLTEMRTRVECVQLGGAAGDRQELGADAPAVAHTMAAELNLHDPKGVWHTARDGLAEYAGILSMITGSLGKVGQDLCLMAQQGIDEVVFVDGGSSSAMPHKQNPIRAELLVTLAQFNAVQVSAMHHALVHEQERSGSAWALEWMILPQMAVAAARSLSAGKEICERITRLGPATA